jgi:lipid-A-disaccharide synthase
MQDVVIVAGETSGDMLAAHLVDELRATRPDVRFSGVCGPKMRAAGVEPWFDSETLAVRGYVEVLGALPRIFRLKRELLARIRERRPALYIGVDAPDFNLRVERDVKAMGIRVAHYVCPSFWAWRAERAKRFHESVDRMLCVFPFEPSLLAAHGVDASFVGHPMVPADTPDTDKQRLRKSLARFRDDQETAEYIAVLPGSRVSELNYHAELFVDTIELVAREFPTARFLVPLVDRKTRAIFEAALWKEGRTVGSRVDILFGHADFALRAADIGLIASGTASLEAAIHGCPHVVTYRISAMTYAIVKRKLTLPYVSLPNILEKEKFVPEFLQKDATPQKLAAALIDLLRDSARREAMTARFNGIRDSLRAPTATPFTDAIAPMLDQDATPVLHRPVA